MVTVSFKLDFLVFSNIPKPNATENQVNTKKQFDGWPLRVLPSHSITFSAHIAKLLLSMKFGD
jgi:hypothetical protein